MERKQAQLSQNKPTQVLWNMLDDEQSAQLVGGGGVVSGSPTAPKDTGVIVGGISTNPIQSKTLA